MSDRLEFRHSPKKQLGLAAIGCALTAVCFYMATHDQDVVFRVLGWLGVGLFVLTTGMAITRMITSGTPFVFDRSGIAFHTGNLGLIPWTDIETFAVITLRGNRLLALTFRDPDRTLARVSAAKRKWAQANKGMGWGHWSFSFTGLTPGIDEAVAFISQYVAASV
ncbi:MAG TPA: STM3941 family protein [Thermoanaerobaculia bacterium]